MCAEIEVYRAFGYPIGTVSSTISAEAIEATRNGRYVRFYGTKDQFPVQPKAPWADNQFRKQWKATFPVRPGEVYRVRVREVEFIPNKTDHQSTQLQTGTAGEVNERLVFTDIVQLPVL